MLFAPPTPPVAALLSVAAALIFSTALDLSVKSAEATTFSPVACPLCSSGSWASAPFSYDSLAEIANDPNFAGHYINNVRHYRYFIASQYVAKVRLRFASFATEIADVLSLGQAGAELTLVSGPGIQPNTLYTPDTPSTLQTRPIQMLFTADESGGDVGFNIDQADVCCNAVPGSPIPIRGMLQGERYTGILLGSEDVVYFWRDAGPSGTRLHVTLWDQDSTGLDLDIYARCNAIPTPSAFDIRGYSSDPMEFIASGPDQCVGGIWYIAVHSYSGSGQFNVVASDAKVSETETETGVLSIRAGIYSPFNPNPPTAAIRDALAAAIKRLYGASEGKIIFDVCDVWPNAGQDCGNCGGAPCDICFIAGTEMATSPVCTNGKIRVYSWYGQWTSPDVIAHELSHKYLCIPDEYYPQGCFGVACTFRCGHSIMANPSAQNNFCLKGTGFIDHGEDRTPGEPTPPTASAWNYVSLSGRVVSVPTSTPDDYDYFSHDFNNSVTCTIH